MKKLALILALLASPAFAQPTPLSTSIANLSQIAPKKIAAGTSGWLEPIIPSTETNAVIKGLSPLGTGGVLGATRTSDSTAAGSQGAQGVSGFCLNNNTTQIQTCYGGYLEARRYAGAGITQGLEVNPLNGGSTVDEDPYAPNGAGLTEAYRASAGRSDTTLNHPVSAAYSVVNNGAYFRRGVVCAYGSLDPTGSSDCLAMASGYRVSWYASAGVVGAQMYGGIGGAGTTGEFDFSAVNASATAVRCTLMGLANNSFACNGPLDLGLAAYRWNRVYASYVNTNGTPPTSSSSACVAGDQAWDANFEYRCVATNTWKRAALSAF